MEATVSKVVILYTESKLAEKHEPSLPTSDRHVYEGFAGSPQTMRRVPPQK